MVRKYYDFGSVSSGTMLDQDLIPSFVDELEWLIGKNGGSIRQRKWAELREIKRNMAKDGYYEPENGEARGWDLDYLFDALNEFAPPYFYFGAHPGDGADYGFWLEEEFNEIFDGLKVNDLSEVPKDYRGEVVDINDHGNMSLYLKNSRRFVEIWSIV